MQPKEHMQPIKRLFFDGGKMNRDAITGCEQIWRDVLYVDATIDDV